MKNVIKVLSLTLFSVMMSLNSNTAFAAPVVLDITTNCTAGNAINGIAVSDVTGNIGGATDCWGTFDGNDPGPSGDGFDIDGTIFNFVAKDDADTGLSGTDISLMVGGNGTSSGTWSFDSSKFNPTEFLIVLKAANSPGFAAWVFDGTDALSDAGSWLVAWTNSNGKVHDLSHFAVYAPTVVPVPAAAWLFGSGLLGLVAVSRRKIS